MRPRLEFDKLTNINITENELRSLYPDIPTPALPAPGLEKGSGGPRGGEEDEGLSEEQLSQIRV